MNLHNMGYPKISLQMYLCHTFHSSPRLAASRRRVVPCLLFDPAMTTASRLSSVSDTDRTLRRGLQRPNCHSHGLTSYTLLPLRPSTAAASAIPKRAGLEVPQLVRYNVSSVALQETGKEWHPAKHIFARGDVQDRSRGRLVQLGGGTIHGSSGRQLELLKGPEVLKNTK